MIWTENTQLNVTSDEPHGQLHVWTIIDVYNSPVTQDQYKASSAMYLGRLNFLCRLHLFTSCKVMHKSFKSGMDIVLSTFHTKI